MVDILMSGGLQPPFPSVEVYWKFGAKAPQDKERQALHTKFLDSCGSGQPAGTVSHLLASHKQLPTSS